MSGILIIALLCAALAGCGKDTYDDGYEAVFSAEMESAVGNDVAAEAAQVEAYEEERFVLITDAIPPYRFMTMVTR